MFDSADEVPKDAPPETRPHVCSLCISACSASFPTAQPLAQHMRIKHEKRSSIQNYVDDSGVCPCCCTNFVTRIRVIAHLSDTRVSRCRCRIAILNGEIVPEIHPSIVVKLNSRDRELKKLAYKEGHTHVLAAKSARCASGKRIGSVRA